MPAGRGPHAGAARDHVIHAMQLIDGVRTDDPGGSRSGKALAQATECLAAALASSGPRAPSRDSSIAAAPRRIDRAFVTAERDLRGLRTGFRLAVHAVPEPAPLVAAHPGQLEYLLVTMIAAASRGDAPGGRLTIRCETVDLAAPESGRLTLPAGEYAMIVVRDSEERLPESAMAPASWSPEVAGTGFDAVARAAVDLGGRLLRPRDGQDESWTLLLLLPIARRAGRRSASRGTAGTVLLVEDDSEVRECTARILVGAGYRVLEAADARSALELAHGTDDPIDLVITDLVLPDGHGGRLANELTRLRGDRPVLFVSGYEDRAIRHHRLIDPRAHLLAKPFTREALLDAISAVRDL